MNGKIAKEIKYDVDTKRLSNNDELNKSIVIQVNSDVIARNNQISDKLINMTVMDYIKYAVDVLKDISKFVKRVNLNAPNKKTFSGRLFDIPLYADTNPATLLGTYLRFVPAYYSYTQDALDKVNEIEKEYQDMINNYSFNNLTVYNKTSLLATFEGLKQYKLSLLKILECFEFILNNPYINRFSFYWNKYRKTKHFPKKCLVNDEAYKFTEYMNMLTIKGETIFENYEYLLRLVRVLKREIPRNGIVKPSYESEYRLLKTFYDYEIMDKMFACLNRVEKAIKENGPNKKANSQLTSIGLIRREFIKLQNDIETIMTSDKYQSLRGK